jgi:hypothetical protein
MLQALDVAHTARSVSPTSIVVPSLRDQQRRPETRSDRRS